MVWLARTYPVPGIAMVIMALMVGCQVAVPVALQRLLLASAMPVVKAVTVARVLERMVVQEVPAIK
jgi:hypothetical protein